MTHTRLGLSHLKPSRHGDGFSLLDEKQHVTLSVADMTPSLGCTHCQEEVSTGGAKVGAERGLAAIAMLTMKVEDVLSERFVAGHLNSGF